MATFINPVPSARVTSEFGYRKDPVTGKQGVMHRGIDLAKSGDVPVLASAGGTVLRAGVIGTYGYTVIIKHSINGKRQDTVYAHLRAGSIKVKVGQTVKQGQTIGLMGSTGKSTGQHLHFEIHEGAWATGQPNARNPRNYVNFNGSATASTSNETLVGYLASKGQSTDFNSRAKLASKHGIANYKGTAEQNILLLAKLKKAEGTSKVKYTSLVDYLKANKQPTDMASRKKLAEKHGIKNYKGTASQNTKLLDILQK